MSTLHYYPSVASAPKGKADHLVAMFSENSVLDDPSCKSPQTISSTCHSMWLFLLCHNTVCDMLQSLEINKASKDLWRYMFPMPKKKKKKNMHVNWLLPYIFSYIPLQALPQLAGNLLMYNLFTSSPCFLSQPSDNIFMSVLSKIMDKAINIQLHSYLDSPNLITNHQYDFWQFNWWCLKSFIFGIM